MFVDPVYRDSDEYRAFWAKLGRGEYDSAQYKRIAKGGREVWIQASYNPILDATGRPVKVVKYATDITEQVKFAHQLRNAVAETEAAVNAAAQGDLTKRINVADKSGELAKLSKSVNALIDVVTELVFSDRNEYLAWIETLGVAAIATDEERFLERSRMRAYVIEEHTDGAD